MKYKDGDPCSHKGCLNHVYYPCEVCGRVQGKPLKGWIDAEEVRPNSRTMIIAYCVPLYGNNYVTGCWYESGEFYDQGRTVRVSHWQMFPLQPKEE